MAQRNYSSSAGPSNVRDEAGQTQPVNQNLSIPPMIHMNSWPMSFRVAPKNTALIILNMQNLFMSSCLGWHETFAYQIEANLLNYGIPAARRAGIQVVWINWGVTKDSIRSMPPAIREAFSPATTEDVNESNSINPLQTPLSRRPLGVGVPLGNASFEDGFTIDAGDMLIIDHWNTALHDPLNLVYAQSLNTDLPDQIFHKHVLSGLSADGVESFLRSRNISTLLVAGMNTDECILATLQDACNKQFDTVLLADGITNNAYEHGWQIMRSNFQRAWGFVSSLRELGIGTAAEYSAPRPRNSLPYSRQHVEQAIGMRERRLFGPPGVV